MNVRRALIYAGLLTTVMHSAFAGEVMFFKQGETPDPHRVAAILDASSSTARVKMRSIRLLPDNVASAPATEQSPAAAPDVPDSEPAAFAIPVQFAFDSVRILPEATGQLDAVAAGIKLAGPDVKVVVEGHTDAVGSSAYNLILSRQRAEAVKGYLVAHGIPAAKLIVLGKGKAEPLNNGDPLAAENRRVQFRAAVSAVAAKRMNSDS